jgi:hypothetical protein
MAKENKTIADNEVRKDKEAGPRVSINWDTSNMRSTYANVCNVSSTQEEVNIIFGTNKSWHSNQSELVLEITDRLILSPFTAKRLSMLLNNVLKEYESRYGEVQIGSVRPEYIFRHYFFRTSVNYCKAHRSRPCALF